MSISLSSITPSQLRRAADLKDKIEALNQELAAILDGSASESAKVPKKKGGMSAAGRAAVAAAQKARWAKLKSAKDPVKRSKMTAAARAKIAAAQKARWAKVKSAKAKA